MRWIRRGGATAIFVSLGVLAACRDGGGNGNADRASVVLPTAVVEIVPTARNRTAFAEGTLDPRRIDLHEGDGDRRLLVTEKSGVVQLWSLKTGHGLPATGDPVKILDVRADALDARFAAQGQAIVVGDMSGGVSLWDTAGRRLWRFRNVSAREGLRSGGVRAVVASGPFLLFGDARGGLTVLGYDAKPVATRENAHDGVVLALAASADGRIVISEGADTRLRGWRLNTDGGLDELSDYRPVNEKFRKMLANLIKYDVQWGWDRSIALAPDGNTFVSATFEGSVQLRSVSGELLREWKRAHGDHHVRTVAFSSDGARMISGGFDGSVRMWDARKEDEGKPLHGNLRAVTCVAVDSDGGVYSAGLDGTVRMWNAKGVSKGRLPRDRPPQARRGEARR